MGQPCSDNILYLFQPQRSDWLSSDMVMSPYFFLTTPLNLKAGVTFQKYLTREIISALGLFVSSFQYRMQRLLYCTSWCACKVCKEGERGSVVVWPQVNLPRFDLNWMRRSFSVLIEPAVMAKQRHMGFGSSVSLHTSVLKDSRPAGHPLRLYNLHVKVAGPYVTNSPSCFQFVNDVFFDWDDPFLFNNRLNFI